MIDDRLLRDRRITKRENTEVRSFFYLTGRSHHLSSPWSHLVNDLKLVEKFGRKERYLIRRETSQSEAVTYHKKNKKKDAWDNPKFLSYLRVDILSSVFSDPAIFHFSFSFALPLSLIASHFL